MSGSQSHNHPLSLTPLGRPDTQATSQDQAPLLGKMAKNEVKRHKKSESKESRAVDWGGGKGHSPRTSDFLAFFPDCGAWSRARMLETHKKVYVGG